MGVVPASDDVMETSGRIDQIREILRVEDSLLCQLLFKSAKMSSDLKELASLQSRLEDMNSSLDLIKDFVRFK